MKAFSSIGFFLILCLSLVLASNSSETNLHPNKSCSNLSGPAPALKSPVKPDLDFGNLPLYFISNKGQVKNNAAFYAKTSTYTLWMTKEGLVFDSLSGNKGKENIEYRTRNVEVRRGKNKLRSHHSPGIERDVSKLLFLNAAVNPEIVPLEKTLHKVNYFIGKNQGKWYQNVPTSRAVLYKNLYKNIDFKVYGIEKQIEYDWIVKPGGDPGAIQFKYENVKRTRIEKNGDLLIETGFGKLLHQKPLSYQEAKGEEPTKVNVKFKKLGKNTYGLEVGNYDKNRELIIDPVVLTYSTYLGGDSEDESISIEVDGSGCVYMTGYTLSTNFPTLNQYQSDADISDSAYDVFVTKLSATGDTLIYSTYLGGDDDDEGYDLAVDGSGNVYVTGYTLSTDFPTLNQYQDEGDINDLASDVFVTKLSPSGDSLLYSTYLGGDDDEDGNSIALDGSGNVYITGYTCSTDFPTLNSYQTNVDTDNSFISDAFVTKMDTTQSGANSLLYSTYLGGDAYDAGYGIAVDSNNNAYVTGLTDSTDYPTLNPYQTNADTDNDMASDVFVTKIDATQSGANSLLYSTYLGGDHDDIGWSIAVDNSFNVYVTGGTDSEDFPLANPYSSSIGGFVDAFVAKLSSTGDSLVYSTYLGGSVGGFFMFFGYDEGYGIAVDGTGSAYVTGYTNCTDFPVVNAFENDYQGDMSDSFVTKLSPAGDSLVYSSYLGGSDEDGGNAIALGGSGNVYIAGYTYSTDFPTLNPYQSTNQGDLDGFAVKLGEVPTVTTQAISSITLTTASSGGNVTNSGGSAVIARGVCWSTSPNPTVSDGITSNGSGMGTFTSSITGLASATTYYVRAYATNSCGTGYGDEVVFSTNVTISGTVTDGTSPIQNVEISFSHDSHTETTDAGGSYSYVVPFGTTTTIIPSHAAVTSWTPNYIYLDNISANMSNQDFLAVITNSCTISGTITSGGSGVANVTMTGLPGNPTTNASGYYSASVYFGWSGTATPSLAGYVFTPNSITYSNVVSDQTNQNYTAVSGNPVISGMVRTSGGVGISNAFLSFSNGGGTTHTDANGYYSHTVIAGWSGTLTPSYNDYMFSPASISYSNLTSSQENQIFTAISTGNPVISGIVWTLEGNRLPGVSLTFSNSRGTAVTDQNGYYSHAVASGWSGSVTPSKEGYEFIPAGRSYTGVTSGQSNNDFIAKTGTSQSPEILLNRNQLNFGAGGSSYTGSQSILVENNGSGTLNWTASTNQAWLKHSPASGTDSGIVSVSVDVGNLATGTYTGTITISDPNAVNTPQTVDVTLIVYAATKAPFGVFSTPINDSTVCSSIPVTGWVLDDVEVSSVKIYREAGNELVFVGNAVFVEGARPDVELAYPGYPWNYRAGWGYMLLTNFLAANSGNGTFTLHAIATDREGNEVTLGKKTITVDNTTAVKPFGTIDTPEQGGIISGADFVNWGWVLTPKPNTIPVDGSTLDVYIDGVNIGNPGYNIYREDIADLFPGYNNSSGAVGKFHLDTTNYKNGVHTIQWRAVDDAGNHDGIGSRYFSIQNTGAGSRSSGMGYPLSGHSVDVLSLFPSETAKPITIVKRVGNSAKTLKIISNIKGLKEIETKELEPLEIRLGTSLSRVSGYMIVGNKIGALPIGSTLEKDFYWSPGPGFYGRYKFLFIIEEKDGSVFKQVFTVNVKPLFAGK